MPAMMRVSHTWVIAGRMDCLLKRHRFMIKGTASPVNERTVATSDDNSRNENTSRNAAPTKSPREQV